MDPTYESLGLEAILPAQWFLPRPPLSGVERLMLAVLEEAWWLLHKTGRAHLEAVDWLYSEEEGPFSFPNICSVLRLGSPVKLRVAMLLKARPPRLHGRKR